MAVEFNIPRGCAQIRKFVWDGGRGSAPPAAPSCAHVFGRGHIHTHRNFLAWEIHNAILIMEETGTRRIFPAFDGDVSIGWRSQTETLLRKKPSCHSNALYSKKIQISVRLRSLECDRTLPDLNFVLANWFSNEYMQGGCAQTEKSGWWTEQTAPTENFRVTRHQKLAAAKSISFCISKYFVWLLWQFAIWYPDELCTPKMICQSRWYRKDLFISILSQSLVREIDTLRSLS